jgi:hypothetical protein
MTRAIADITYAITGQLLTHRVLQGRPTSATFKVFNDYAGDDETAEFTGSATVDSVSTTVSSASGLGQTDPHRISLTSTTGVTVGTKYMIAEGGAFEWFAPLSIGSGFVRARRPLRNAYTTAATVVGTTISAVVDATWVADEGNLSDHLDPNPDYRVRWEIVIGSETLVQYSYFDLVRAPVRLGIDGEDVEDRAPGLHDTWPTDYQRDQGRPILQSAWRMVQAELGVMEVDTDAVRDEQLLDELTIRAALVVLAEGGWKPLAFGTAAEYHAIVRPSFDRFLEKSFMVRNARRLAAGTTGGAERVEALPIIAK